MESPSKMNAFSRSPEITRPATLIPFHDTATTFGNRFRALPSIQQRDGQGSDPLMAAGQNNLRAPSNSPYQGKTIDSTISKDETANAKEKEEKLLRGLHAMNNSQASDGKDNSVDKVDKSDINKDINPNIGPGGAQGSTTKQGGGIEGAAGEFYTNMNGRMPMSNTAAAAAAAAAAANQGQNSNGNHALQDYQMQLMLLEQQNKRRLLLARQEQDMAHPASVGPNGQFAPGMSPDDNGSSSPLIASNVVPSNFTSPKTVLPKPKPMPSPSSMLPIPYRADRAQPGKQAQRLAKKPIRAAESNLPLSNKSAPDSANAWTVDHQSKLQDYSNTLSTMLKNTQTKLSLPQTVVHRNLARQNTFNDTKRRSPLVMRSPRYSTSLPQEVRSPVINENITASALDIAVAPEILEQGHDGNMSDVAILNKQPVAAAEFRPDAGPDRATLTTLNEALVSRNVLDECGVPYETHPSMPGTITILEHLNFDKLQALLELTHLSYLRPELEVPAVNEDNETHQLEPALDSESAQQKSELTNGTLDNSSGPGEQSTTIDEDTDICPEPCLGKRDVASPMDSAPTPQSEVDWRHEDVSLHTGQDHYCGANDIETRNFGADSETSYPSACPDPTCDTSPHFDLPGSHTRTEIRVDDTDETEDVQKAQLLSNPKPYSPEEEAKKIEILTSQILELQTRIAKLSLAQDAEQPSPSPWPVLHRVYCTRTSDPAIYLDKPVWVQDDDHHQHLDARRRISDEVEWEARQKDTPFVVYLDYSCRVIPKGAPGKTTHSRRRGARLSSDEELKVSHYREEVHILSMALREALDDVFQSDNDIESYRPDEFDETGIIAAPYIFNFQFGSRFEDLLHDFGDECSQEYPIFLDYIKEQSKQAESAARLLFEREVVTPRFMPYLFVPGEMLVKKDQLLTATKLLGNIEGPESTSSGESGLQDEIWTSWSCYAESIWFDGKFRRKREPEAIDCEDFEKLEISIQDLPVYPLRFASDEDVEYLMRRGQLFFSCRNGRYMMGPAENDGGLSNVRYMVDILTYNLIHTFKLSDTSRSDGDIIEVDESFENDSDFILRLPNTTKGFHMQDKKWFTLPVDGLKPVEWNEDAFKNLAVDDDTKELVKALVTNKIEADRGTDVVAGKGTGLIMLLHGGPGTGKTLTAEGVAEIARKPLYRVTCGDVGTKPRAVEEYLESVFQLGRTWGCVVLLDEAEVFLEERSTLSLERNALVSVFLRVLEYYDGILLLTTNRVGTFDEAFRSRIQLALHYETLTEQQRRQIWKNFIQRLEYLQEDMDFAGIKSHIDDLASWQMNGRQIRNVITTARQLAKFQKKPVTNEHFNRVIRVCKKFDDYLADVKDAVELQDQKQRAEAVARDLGLR